MVYKKQNHLGAVEEAKGKQRGKEKDKEGRSERNRELGWLSFEGGGSSREAQAYAPNTRVEVHISGFTVKHLLLASTR